MRHHRIREAVLQQRFDPRVLEVLGARSHLSGGAGASPVMVQAGQPGPTANVAGGVYTWTYRGEDDPYTDRFADHLIKIKNYMRLVPGDNRMLPMRNAYKDPSAPRDDRMASGES
jgi:hypothetical protein